MNLYDAVKKQKSSFFFLSLRLINDPDSNSCTISTPMHTSTFLTILIVLVIVHATLGVDTNCVRFNRIGAWLHGDDHGSCLCRKTVEICDGYWGPEYPDDEGMNDSRFYQCWESREMERIIPMRSHTYESTKSRHTCATNGCCCRDGYATCVRL